MSERSTPTEVVGTLPEKKKRGRKPKVRHDVEAAPQDGHGDRLSFENKRAGWRYGWLNARDLQRYKRAGAEELREGDHDRPVEWCGDRNSGDIVRYNELTAIRIPETEAVKLEGRDWMRQQHSRLMGTLVQDAKDGVSTFERATKSIGSGSIQLPT